MLVLFNHPQHTTRIPQKVTMKFFSVIFTAALATAVLAAPVEVAERQVEAQGLGSGSKFSFDIIIGRTH